MKGALILFEVRKDECLRGKNITVQILYQAQLF